MNILAQATAESNFPAEKDPRSGNRGRAKGQAIRRAYTDEHREFFREEEESRDVFTVKRVHIRLTGSLEAGALLSQVIYWHMPSKKDQLTRCQVTRGGEVWLVKQREDWWAEVGLTPKRFDRVARELQEQGLIRLEIHQFNGAPTVHIHLELETLIEKLKELRAAEAGRICPKEENGNSPMGKNDIPQMGKSILPKGEEHLLQRLPTEITTEITTEGEGSLDAPPLESRPSSITLGPDPVQPIRGQVVDIRRMVTNSPEQGRYKRGVPSPEAVNLWSQYLESRAMVCPGLPPTSQEQQRLDALVLDRLVLYGYNGQAWTYEDVGKLLEKIAKHDFWVCRIGKGKDLWTQLREAVIGATPRRQVVTSPAKDYGLNDPRWANA